MSSTEPTVVARRLAAGVGVGAVIGLLYALLARPRDEVFLTGSWGYVPADSWLLHAAVVGVTFGLVMIGGLLGWWAVAALVRRRLLFVVVGVGLVAGALVFFGRAALGDETIGGRIAWVVMGLFVGGLGVPMTIAGWRAARVHA